MKAIKDGTFDEEQINSYRNSLIAELKNQGATKSDLDLVTDIIVINSLNERRGPRAVAWAILQ